MILKHYRGMVTILFSPMNKLWASLRPLVGMPVEREVYHEESNAEVARCCSINFRFMSAVLPGFSPFFKNVRVYDASFILLRKCVKRRVEIHTLTDSSRLQSKPV